MLDLEIVLHICLIRISLPYLWLTIALILLLLRYETSKLDDLKTTQISHNQGTNPLFCRIPPAPLSASYKTPPP